MVIIYDPKEIRKELARLTFDDLKEIDPRKYGFARVADMFIYVVTQEGATGVLGVDQRLAQRIDPRLETMPKHKAAYQRAIENEDLIPGDESLIEEVRRLEDRETVAAIGELTGYWRTQGKL